MRPLGYGLITNRNFSLTIQIHPMKLGNVAMTTVLLSLNLISNSKGCQDDILPSPITCCLAPRARTIEASQHVIGPGLSGCILPWIASHWLSNWRSLQRLNVKPDSNNLAFMKTMWIIYLNVDLMGMQGVSLWSQVAVSLIPTYSFMPSLKILCSRKSAHIVNSGQSQTCTISLIFKFWNLLGAVVNFRPIPQMFSWIFIKP